MEKDNIHILQDFIALEEDRSKIALKGTLEAMLDYMQYIIRSQFDKNSKSSYKFKKRKAQLHQQFINAFNSMNRNQKVEYYKKIVTMVKNISDNIINYPQITHQTITVQGYTRSYNLKMWKKKKIRLDKQRHILYAQKSDKIKHYNLGDYLLRQSKNKDYHSFVLQAINNSPHQKSKTVHIGFHDPKQYIYWSKNIQASIDYKLFQYIHKTMSKNNQGSMARSTVLTYSYQNKQQKVYNSQIDHVQPISYSARISQQQPQKQKKFQHSDSSDQQVNSKPLKQQLTKKIQQKRKNSPQKLKIQQTHQLKNTIIDSLLQSDNDQQIQKIKQQQNQNIKNNQKKHLDLFHKISPDYQLQDLQNFNNFQQIINQNNFKVLQHIQNKKKLKIQMNFNQIYPKQSILQLIVNTTHLIKFNQSIQQFTIKTMIASQNSAIMYQKNKSYNKLYRPRDFVFIRHVFANLGDLYIIDKSLENSSYPPFITIVRGKLINFWGILTRNNKIIILIQMQQSNEGYLNDVQQLNLTMKYIQGLRLMQYYLKNNLNNLNKLKLFDISWDITKNQANTFANQVRKKRKTQRLQIKNISKKKQQDNKNINNNNKHQQLDKLFKKKQQNNNKYTQSSFQNNQNFHSYHDITNIQNNQYSFKNIDKSIIKAKKDMDQVGQIDAKQLAQKQKQKTLLSIVRQFNNQGMVIISQNYIKNKYRLKPQNNCPLTYQQVIADHPIWKGQWLHDDKQGGIIFINQKKIQDQKGVISFILAKIGKNLLSGKSILSISLPVDIFCAESNLQRLLISMTYAPLLLEPATKKNTFEKMKSVIAFGVSNSSMYLNMEKPFNPILGETFQCWINGCPGYAEQISHHPPIAALYFIGRGYKITAQLESKVQLHMNSGCGTNDGIVRVQYDDGTQVCFITPGGQISGLAYGDRKFNIVGKSYYWVQKQNIVVQVVFNPTKKGFFSIGKQQQPSDYFQGIIYQVKPQFTKTFSTKKKPPSQKDIIKDLGKISGIWNKYVNFNNECLLDISKDYPLKLQYQPHPLPSDANWRQDIAYRRIMQVSRAQTQKQRLQNFQRQDRKLRQKYKKK